MPNEDSEMGKDHPIEFNREGILRLLPRRYLLVPFRREMGCYFARLLHTAVIISFGGHFSLMGLVRRKLI